MVGKSVQKISDKQLKDFLYDLYKESTAKEVLDDITDLLILNSRGNIEGWYLLNKFINSVPLKKEK